MAIIQRFGGALNLNVHIHALLIDGVFAKEGDLLRFHPARRLPNRAHLTTDGAVDHHHVDQVPISGPI